MQEISYIKCSAISDIIMDILFKMFQERQLMLMASTSTTTPPPMGFDKAELCGHSWKNDTLVTSMRFWVAGVSLAVTDTLGLLGNVISLITLSTMTKRGLFIKLLVALTVFDIMFLVNGKSTLMKFDLRDMMFRESRLLILREFEPVLRVLLVEARLYCM